MKKILIITAILIGLSQGNSTSVLTQTNSTEKSHKRTRQPINFQKQLIYSTGIGLGAAVLTGGVVSFLSMTSCEGGWDCIGAVLITVLATEVAYGIGTATGTIIGSDDKLTTGGKIGSFLGSGLGLTTSFWLISNSNISTNSSLYLSLVSNIILPPLFSTIMSRIGVKQTGNQSLYSFSNSSFGVPKLNIGILGGGKGYQASAVLLSF